MPLTCVSRRLVFALVLAVLFGGAPVAGCKRKKAAPASSLSGGGVPRVRVIHALADGPAVDVYASNVKIVSGLAYKADTGYLAALPGTFTVRATAAGSNETAYGPAPVTLAGGTDYTVVVAGSVTGKNVQPLILTDDKAPPLPGRARVRVVHAAAPDAPPVDLLLNDRVAISNLKFGQATGAYAEFPAGTYQLKVASVGGETVVLGPLPLALASGRTYTVLVLGRAADRTLNVQTLTDR